MAISRKYSDGIKALGFLCALMVVAIHCWSPTKYFAGEPDLVGWRAAVAFFGTCTFVRIAVPFFFVITGFFLACSDKGWIELMRRRFVTLYIPFVIWNALNVVLNFAAGRFEDVTLFVALEKIFGWNPMIKLGCMQFWYLQSIFVVVLLWPIVKMLMSRWWTAAVVLAVLFSGWIHVYRYWLGMAMCPGHFLWICVGVLAGLKLDDFKRLGDCGSIRWIKFLFLFVFAASIIAKVYFGVVRNIAFYDLSDYILIASGLITVFANLNVFGRVADRLKPVLGLSFFIFAFHTIGITIALRLGGRVGLDGLSLYFFKIVFAIGLSIAVGAATRRLLPRIFGLLTGGRG